MIVLNEQVRNTRFKKVLAMIGFYKKSTCIAVKAGTQFIHAWQGCFESLHVQAERSRPASAIACSEASRFS